MSRLLVLAAATAALSLVALSLAAPAAGTKYALIVGVTKYDSNKLPLLRFTENDAEKLAATLTAGGYEVRVLTNTRGARSDRDAPTAANIRREIDALVEKKKRGDLVLLAFSGHGIQMSARDPEGKGVARTYAYFCPSDADLAGDISYATGRSDSLIHLNDTLDRLGRCGAGTRLVLVDACRNEMEATAVTKAADLGVIRVPAGVAALFSCKAGEKSHEIPKLEHGLFFYYVLEALRKATNEDGEVTWTRMLGHVHSKVTKNAGDLAGGGADQEPRQVAAEVGDPVLLGRTAKGEITRLPSRFENVAGMTMVRIPGTKEQFPKKGTFTMGSPKSEKERDSNEQQHEVEISEFYLGSKEVTVGQWRAFATDADYETVAEKEKGEKTWKIPGFAQEDDHPVTWVNWNDARAYCDWLSNRAVKKRPRGWVYRLPREAEWEYACRGGADSYRTFHFGDTLDDSHTQANFHGNLPYNSDNDSEYRDKPRATGSYKPNGFGLYDMHGNVGEWCADWYGADYYGKSDGANDPPGPSDGSLRVIRGGGYFSDGKYCRSAVRPRGEPPVRSNGIGFRVALVPSGRGKME